MYALGVDIGGTFTDFSLVNLEDGTQHFLKRPTDHSDLSGPVLAGIRDLLANVEGGQSGLAYLAHGSTIAINTVIERTGVTLGMLCTQGFGDILELRRVRMPVPIRFDATRPAALIPRALVEEITERTSPAGKVLTAPDEDQVIESVQRLVAGGAVGIVLVLLHSYIGPTNELTIKTWINERWPHLDVYCSSDLLPQIREYERATCTTLNAYVEREVSSYVSELQAEATAAGLKGELFMTKSNGGCTTAGDAIAKPVQTLLSGPASGIVGAADAASRSDATDVLTFDMGGTSTDLGVIRDGQIVMSREGVVGDFPIVLPAVEVTSIGAGGSSLAYRSPSGALRVGPLSAGSMPGPACYGRGGTEATVTDALLACGIITEASFAGGSFSLDQEAAHLALSSLGETMDLSGDECADAIVRVASAGLMLGTKGVLARHGLDPGDFTLLAFGGAGPVFAAFVAEELGLSKVLIPARPGTLCARGALVSPVRGDFVRTVYKSMSALDNAGLREVAMSLRRQAGEWLAGVVQTDGEPEVRLVAAMRYVGQAWDLDVPCDVDDGLDLRSHLEAEFHRIHKELYGHSDESGQVELIELHAAIISPRQLRQESAGSTGGFFAPGSTRADATESVSATTRRVRMNGAVEVANVYARHTLTAGQRIVGPAIVEQEDTTTVVPVGFVAYQDSASCLILHQEVS